jgi:hypothetical protein
VPAEHLLTRDHKPQLRTSSGFEWRGQAPISRSARAYVPGASPSWAPDVQTAGRLELHGFPSMAMRGQEAGEGAVEGPASNL